MNAFIWAHGGFGDVAWSYLFNENWQRLEAFKKENPNCKLKAIIISYNIQSLELMRFNPAIDEIDFRAPNWEQRDRNMPIIDIATQYAYGYTQCTKLEGFSSLPKRPQKIYLNLRTEASLVDYIQKQGPYIVLHPFAGDKSRAVAGEKEYKVITKYITDELKYNVVILGGTHQKIIGQDRNLNKEEMDIKGDKVFNLVNKTTARVGIRLLKNAVGCIGTWSCWSTLSWGFGNPTILLTDERNRKGIDFVLRDKYKKYKKPCHYNIFTKDNSIPTELYYYLGKL
jgi:ADP-heptose:LPS heptosyltransferase